MALKRFMPDRVLEFYQVCSNNEPCLTFKYLMARSRLVPCEFVWEKVKTIDFSETIVVKLGRRSYLNEYVNLYEYQRSRSFIDLRPSLLRFNIFKLFSLETAWSPYTYMVKIFKNLLVWKQKTDYLEAWCAVLANRLLPNLFK